MNRHLAARVTCVLLILITTISCAHRTGLTNRQIAKMMTARRKFVLVFGSMSTPSRLLARPTIRFVRQPDSKSPELPLWTATISTGDRSYAVLHAPADMTYVDELYIEVGNAGGPFDKIAFVRLQESDEPLALYFGEMHMSPPRNAAGRVSRSQSTSGMISGTPNTN